MRWVLRLLLSEAELRQIEVEQSELHENWTQLYGAAVATRRLRQERMLLVPRLIIESIRAAASSIVSALPSAGRDTRHAIRGLVRTPGTTATIVITLGLALGTTTAMLAIVQGVLLDPLPYAAPESLVWIYTDNPPNKYRFSLVDYQALEAEHPAFSRIAAAQSVPATITGGESPELVRVLQVTASFFPTLGLAPRVGRAFDEQDDGDRAPLAVLTTPYWRRAYGTDAGVVGRAITIDGTLHTIVGVLPENAGPVAQDISVFTLERWSPPRRKGPFLWTVIGRLRPEVSRAVAIDTLRATSARLFPLWKSSFQDAQASWGMQDLKERTIGNVGRPLWFVLIALACLLGLAWTNALHLILARALDRHREWSIRRAMGASGARLYQPILLEHALLATSAVLLAAGIATAILVVVKTQGSAHIPRVDDVSLSGSVLWWLAGLGVTSALVLTAGALTTASRHGTDLERVLRSSGRSTTASRTSRRMAHGLIAAEFAITTPLIVSAVLVTTSLMHLSRVPVGIETGRVLTMGMSLAGERYARADSRAEFWMRTLEHIRALPGVASAALADSRPPLRTSIGNNFELEDRPTPPGQSQPSTPWAFVSPDYFSTVRLGLERGRLFNEDSLRNRELIVDRAWAQRFFPREDAMGRRLRHGGCTNPSCQAWTVAGVVDTVKWQGLDATDEGTVYIPLVDLSSAYVVVRAHGDPAALVLSVRRVIMDLDPSLAVRDIATGDDLVDRALATPRTLSLLAGSFALTALLIALVGIYGAMSHFVRQHTHELGIRLALGGRPADVRRLVISLGVRVAGAGLFIGLLASVAATRVLSSQLFGITQADRVGGLAWPAVLLLAFAAIACAIPGRRASLLNPVSLLRE